LAQARIFFFAGGIEWRKIWDGPAFEQTAAIRPARAIVPFFFAWLFFFWQVV